ncbi:glycosyltransferase 61 family protein [Lichenicoccus sp.]|uniref:glycosyltransferase 61 family protein n=1 Tax=Lichenicoccus sp. TaxID=2781899 RepID=UPI003D11BBA2
MQLVVRRFLEVGELPAAASIASQPPRSLAPPILAYPGQDLAALMSGIRGASVQDSAGGLAAPPLQLRLYTIENGRFLVGHGLDGTILSEDGRPIHQTAAFRAIKQAGEASETRLDLPEPLRLDEVFVGFDGAWRNYFHWMCFGLTKAFLAARHLEPSVMIATPDYREAARSGGISYGETTWQQSLEFSGLAGRVTALPSGLYCARRLHFFWTEPGAPTDIMYLDAFTDVFDRMRAHVIPTSRAFESIHLARSGGVSSRIGDDVNSIVSAVLDRRGFRTVNFEGVDLQQQISIVAGARRLASPHGAGLTNILFHAGGLRVLELNRTLDGSQSFRPWFYVASAVRGHRYVTLDSLGDLGEQHVEQAVSALDAA